MSFQGGAVEGVVADAAATREALVEAIVETDERLMERYLSDEKIAPEELNAACRRAVAGGKIVPVLCCAGVTGIGVKELLGALIRCAPSPADIPPRKGQKGEQEVAVKADPSAPLVAQVFKSVTDPFVGKMSFVRVFSGTLKVDSSVYNARSDRTEKISQLLRPFGKDTEAISEAIPGDLVVIPKLEGVALYDTLCAAGDNVAISAPTLPSPMVALAVQPKSRADEQRLSLSLDKISQEDPTFRVSRDAQTHELVVSGLSTLHIEVILSRLKRRFNVEVTTKEPKIPYKETITVKGEGQHRHKKQTGGHGQFGEVWLRLEPLSRGGGFEFVDGVVGGAIPNQFIPSVEKGLRETLVKGVLAGCPVDDIRVTVYDGKYHTVDSSDAAFRMAASQAFKKGFKSCKPVLLEPIANVEITVPSQYMGDISGNIVSRRGRIQGMESLGEMQVVKAQVPLAEITRYATELRSLTGGQGYFTLEFSHYDIVPSHIAEPLINAAKKTEEEEE
jgi:elongation factor G